MAEDGRRLGRGLAALIGDSSEPARDRDPDRAKSQRQVPIEFLRPNPRNPRKYFDDDNLNELAESISERGLIQPIVVRSIPRTTDAFEIIAGERRWRAAQRAGLHDVPIVVIEATDQQALELAIVENVQRADLNALEEARGYEQLVQEFKYTQADLAKVIGKSRSHVANTMRLLNLSDGIKSMLADGSLSAGHARALLTLKNPDAVASRVVAQGLSVRDVERLSQDEHETADATAKSRGAVGRGKPQKDADTRALEQALTDTLGFTVSIDHKGESGELRIRYNNLDQLDALCQRLRH